MKKIILSIAIVGGILSACGTTKESANISDTPPVMTKNQTGTPGQNTIDGQAWFVRNPQNPGVPGPNIRIQQEEERQIITSNKAGRR
jgi:hypothetical protein